MISNNVLIKLSQIRNVSDERSSTGGRCRGKRRKVGRQEGRKKEEKKEAKMKNTFLLIF